MEEYSVIINVDLLSFSLSIFFFLFYSFFFFSQSKEVHSQVNSNRKKETSNDAELAQGQVLSICTS